MILHQDLFGLQSKLKIFALEHSMHTIIWYLNLASNIKSKI